MKSWFGSLQTRERAFVVAGALALFIAVAWSLVWIPLDKGQEAAAERVSAWKRSLVELRPMRGQAQAIANGQTVVAAQNQSLVVIVDNTLRQRGLTNSVQRSQPTPTGTGIRVEFENAAFDDLVLWLGDLHRQYGLQVESASFSAASGENPGRVNSSVTLQR